MILQANSFAIILKFILIAYGHVKDRSFPLAIQDMPYVVLCSGLEHPAKMDVKLSHQGIASYTAKRHQLVSWQASISVSCWWCLRGLHAFCVVRVLVLEQNSLLLL